MQWKSKHSHSLSEERIGPPIPSISEHADFTKLDVHPVRRDDVGTDDFIIAIMGPTGAGKSTFISTAIGRDSGVGHSLQSFTSQVSAVRVNIMDISVVLVDTPGFDDTYLSDLDILKMISDWLRKTFERKLQLSGLLYMHRISDNRMAGTPLKNLDMFRKLCGEEGFKKVIFTTTIWPDASDTEATDTAIEREKELKQTYWRDMIKEGSSTLRFENTQRSAWCILDQLLIHQSSRQSILIQRELVEFKKHLPNTAAGRQLYGIIEKLVERQRDVLRRMREELKKTSDPSVMQALVDELNTIREERENAVREMRQLDRKLIGWLRRVFPMDRKPSKSRTQQPSIAFPFEERSRSMLKEILKDRNRVVDISHLPETQAQELEDFLTLFLHEGTPTTDSEEHGHVQTMIDGLKKPIRDNRRKSSGEIDYESVYNTLLSLSRIDV
ncbi:hypothetical protein P691DRAFT_725104 [Macrolepiota fuliginosa MF-IS2]|uniref:G domain-containing protein n=1 Tax=Macrolepiota fuliginosa MF-IS2 TaxID=1400762 RepID=A0A9P5XH72_9AGAR|nr:hypothetical protein P691DRAFT_725104 [Macrolepiota fuliginosa MF-IS2]